MPGTVQGAQKRRQRAAVHRSHGTGVAADAQPLEAIGPDCDTGEAAGPGGVAWSGSVATGQRRPFRSEKAALARAQANLADVAAGVGARLLRRLAQLQAEDPDGTTLPDRPWLVWYVEHSRVVSNLTDAAASHARAEAQLLKERRAALASGKSGPNGEGPSDAELIAKLLADLPTAELQEALQRRAKDATPAALARVIDVSPEPSGPDPERAPVAAVEP